MIKKAFLYMLSLLMVALCINQFFLVQPINAIVFAIPTMATVLAMVYFNKMRFKAQLTTVFSVTFFVLFSFLLLLQINMATPTAFTIAAVVTISYYFYVKLLNDFLKG